MRRRSPAYRKIATDLSWRLVAQHYEYGVRRTPARLAAALGRPDPLAEADHRVRSRRNPQHAQDPEETVPIWEFCA